MSEHFATIRWKNTGPEFIKGRYSREHTWSFDGGITVPASPSPLVVPAPWSNPANVDPEEAFIASVSSCHMLTFLWLVSKTSHVVQSYEDEAVGIMTKNEKRVPWVSRITLRPRIVWEGAAPPQSDIDHLHHEAHEQCFIANSIKTEVVVEAPCNLRSFPLGTKDASSIAGDSGRPVRQASRDEGVPHPHTNGPGVLSPL